MKQIERTVNAERVEDLISVFGSFDENIKRIEESLAVSIVNRGTELKVSGDEEAVDKAVRTLEGLLSLAAKGRWHLFHRIIICLMIPSVKISVWDE